MAARGLQLGEDVYINASARLDGVALWLISIGDETVIGPGVQVLAHDATTCRTDRATRSWPLSRSEIESSLGPASIILPGTTIGDDTIIGAGSVVRGDVPAETGHRQSAGRRRRQRTDPRAPQQLEESPHWPSQGWTVKRGITKPRMREMREALGDGSGYLA